MSSHGLPPHQKMLPGWRCLLQRPWLAAMTASRPLVRAVPRQAPLLLRVLPLERPLLLLLLLLKGLLLLLVQLPLPLLLLLLLLQRHVLLLLLLQGLLLALLLCWCSQILNCSLHPGPCQSCCSDR
jgi:hypothetical protein